MNLFSLDTLPVSPWRNGGGETREIVMIPAGEGFSWRASIATIAQDGDFSAFPGIDRIITLLSGGNVALSSPGWRRTLRPAEPFCFRGEDAVYARLSGGVSQDFNLMTCRASHQATLRAVREAVQPAPAASGIAFVLAGEWQVAEHHLRQNDGLWWLDGGAALTPLTSNARMLYAEITPR